VLLGEEEQEKVRVAAAASAGLAGTCPQRVMLVEVTRPYDGCVRGCWVSEKPGVQMGEGEVGVWGVVDVVDINFLLAEEERESGHCV
jgi:hypothetical protein